MSSQYKTAITDEKSHHRVVLITGSGTGIGANIAVDLSSAGYQVIVTGRNQQTLDNVVEKCNKASSMHPTIEAVSYRADLYVMEQVDKLIDFIRLKFNRLDILINNACWRGKTKSILDEGSFEDFQNVMHLNVSVPMYLIHKCLIPLAPKGMDDALVINISSISSQIVVPLNLYSISKACLSDMSRQFAKESREMGIFCVTISPGPVLTEMRPDHSRMSSLTLIERIGATQEISDLALHVVSNAHLFHGKELLVDGGFSAKQITVPAS